MVANSYESNTAEVVGKDISRSKLSPRANHKDNTAINLTENDRKDVERYKASELFTSTLSIKQSHIRVCNRFSSETAADMESETSTRLSQPNHDLNPHHYPPNVPSHNRHVFWGKRGRTGTSNIGGDGQKLENMDKIESEGTLKEEVKRKNSPKKNETPEFKKILRRIKLKSKAMERAKLEKEEKSPYSGSDPPKNGDSAESAGVVEKIEAFEKLFIGQKMIKEKERIFSPSTRKKTVRGRKSTPKRHKTKFENQKTTLDDLWNRRNKAEG